MSAATSAGAVSESVFVEHLPVGYRANGLQCGGQGAVFGGKRANADTVAVGERVVGEFVVDGLRRTDQLAESPAVGGQGGRLQAVTELEVERYALFEGYLKLAGQLGLEAAVYRQATIGGERGAGTGNVDAFRPRAHGCKGQQAAGEQAKQFCG